MRSEKGKVPRVGRLVLWGALLGALMLAACDRIADPTRGTISRERFIQTNVELRQIDPAAPEADSLRAVVLQEHRVTEAQMRAFVETRADRPQELAEIWAEIQRRLEEALMPPDTIPEELLELDPDEDELPQDEDELLQEEAQEMPTREPRAIPPGRLRVNAT